MRIVRIAKWFLLSIVLCTLVGLSAEGALADSRINQWSHFGGDALYCNHDQGCWALNMSGTQLWSVPEATIVKAVADACASNTGIAINAGAGSYGPMTLWLSCPNNITLVGFDEWGKQATMDFTTDYLPVFPANDPHTHGHRNLPSSSDDQCSVDLAGNSFDSVDGIHYSVGYDIWLAYSDGAPAAFLHWSATDEDQPACAI